MNETKSWKRFLNEYITENFVFAIRFVAMRQVTKTEKWNSNPVTIVYASELMPVLTLPFPAITICPLAKSRAEDFNVTRAFEMRNNNKTVDEESEMKLRVLAHVCPSSRHWKMFNESEGENVVPSLRAMALSLEKIMIHCWWRSSSIPCGSIMVERLKDDGICYTFNSLALDEIYRTDQISQDFLNFPNVTPPSDWTRDSGYRYGAGLDAYPKRPLTGGIISGLIATAMIKKEDRQLMCQFYKFYTQFNCIIECVSNYTLATCGCVKFSLPRATGTKICNASKINCYRYAFLKLYEAAVRNMLAGGDRRSCNCMPSCTSIDYQVGMSQTPFNIDDFPIKLNFTTENADAAVLFVFFKYRHYIPLLRRELVGVNQAIAELGGLFTLLMGSSMMSLAEIFYYCCVRPLRRERAKVKPAVKHPRSRGHRIHLRVEPWAKHRHQTLGLYDNDDFI
ncbi:pickpocket protein 28-like [Ochlerotatus camptorhynchus]|uniref:pickpocket protein 28-like n=1 Tax=Ochlerotatus camptorhynchus TaxID=644619 RepID=UPI0031D93602